MGLAKRHRVKLSKSLKDLCTHPSSIKGMCVKCGKILGDNQPGVALPYIHNDFWISNVEMRRLQNADSKKLLGHKKLYLVLDLDHTLLNSTPLRDITPEEKGYLNGGSDALQNSFFRLKQMKMMTKLRPFVHTFLKEASKLFEMYIYTMGKRIYAEEIVKLLDPDDVYFNAKVIAREDCSKRHRKGLDVVPGRESAVVIIDDRANVWGKHRRNLILIRRYLFFASSCRHFGLDCKSLSELTSDERESDGVLAAVLEFLKRVHGLFFDKDDLKNRDVRRVMRTVCIQAKNKLGVAKSGDDPFLLGSKSNGIDIF